MTLPEVVREAMRVEGRVFRRRLSPAAWVIDGATYELRPVHRPSPLNPRYPNTAAILAEDWEIVP